MTSSELMEIVEWFNQHNIKFTHATKEHLDVMKKVIYMDDAEDKGGARGRCYVCTGVNVCDSCLLAIDNKPSFINTVWCYKFTAVDAFQNSARLLEKYLKFMDKLNGSGRITNGKE